MHFWDATSEVVQLANVGRGYGSMWRSMVLVFIHEEGYYYFYSLFTASAYQTSYTWSGQYDDQ